MNPIHDSLTIDRYRHPPMPQGWETGDFLPRHFRPPSPDALASIIRRRGVCPLREICRSLSKPPSVVLPVLRAMPGAVVGSDGWGVIE